MATHRVQRPSTWSVIQRLNVHDKIDLALRVAFYVVALPMVTLAVGVPWLLAAALLVIAFIDTGSLLQIYRAVQWREDAVAFGEKRVMDDMAQTPGGAPSVADVMGHCGCVHRHAYNFTTQEWMPVTVVDSDEFCPVVQENA